MQYKEDDDDDPDIEDESTYEESENFHYHKIKPTEKGKYSHPVFPGNGQLIIGQEQETPCAGFDDTDSLSADISRFEVNFNH